MNWWTCTGPAIDATEEDYDATMAATTKSVFFACQAAARVMIPQGGGRIVNIGSNFAISAFKTRAIYGGAKAAVHQLSRALSLEWAKQNVVVNVVAPCITETESRRPILERPALLEAPGSVHTRRQHAEMKGVRHRDQKRGHERKGKPHGNQSVLWSGLTSRRTR